MESKPWYESKGIWGGIIIVVGAIFGGVTKNYEMAGTIIAAGLGIWGIGVRAAQR